MTDKPTILYVDDEPKNLTAFRASFRRDFRILTAPSGEEALRLLQEEPAMAVLITDQRMPGMTGVELLAQARALSPDTKRIILTGYSDMQAIVQAINDGQAYYYLTKPWVLHDVKLVLERAVESWELGRSNRSLEAEKAALQLKNEQQAKQQILSRFETLRNQVNPHFLFNCLNTLSTLIHEDAMLADDFVSKLTRVYRYVLDLTDQVTVPLTEELAFMKHYTFLQQIRFGNALQVYWQVPESLHGRHLPPMTLQLLVENAVKHNVVSQQNPLRIELFVEAGQFVVRNNLQPRKRVVPSTGLGLKNLRDRIELLSGASPTFGPEGEYFVARVPLLAPQSPANTTG